MKIINNFKKKKKKIMGTEWTTTLESCHHEVFLEELFQTFEKVKRDNLHFWF